MFRFQTLEVWKKGVEFANLIIDVAESLPQRYQSSFGDQMRRAGLSVPNNIAEGNGRKTQKEANNLYNVAKGSTYECINMIIILEGRSLLKLEQLVKNRIYQLAEDISKMLHGLVG